VCTLNKQSGTSNCTADNMSVHSDKQSGTSNYTADNMSVNTE